MADRCIIAALIAAYVILALNGSAFWWLIAAGWAGFLIHDIWKRTDGV